MINEKPVLLSWRFDRNKQIRIPFLFAMSLLQAKDGERASYVELVDELSQHGAKPGFDAIRDFGARDLCNIISPIRPGRRTAQLVSLTYFLDLPFALFGAFVPALFRPMFSELHRNY